MPGPGRNRTRLAARSGQGSGVGSSLYLNPGRARLSKPLRSSLVPHSSQVKYGSNSIGRRTARMQGIEDIGRTLQLDAVHLMD